MEDDARIFRLFIIIIIIDRFSFCSFHFEGLVVPDSKCLSCSGVHSTCFVGNLHTTMVHPHTPRHLYVGAVVSSLLMLL